MLGLGSAAPGMVALCMILAAVVGYLVGSVSFGVLVGKALYGDDIRQKGSGNAGMTNMMRTHGKLGGILTLAGDMGKGYLAVWCGRWLMMLLLPGLPIFYAGYIAGIAALIGHAFPLYFKFKGGKGVATGGGVFLACAPIVAGSLIVLFVIISFASRMVSLGSIIVFILYPICTLFYTLFVSGEDPLYSTVCSAIIGALVVWMHRENIKRIRNGTENKIGSKKKNTGDG